ncbi:hypothetical protein GOODEAATRI_008449 [Goodea atripinnis]|uniref:Uncharacterized protein n=1 Tax=Goodea atripinnis TaxID=208336 RepID=A0ABV0MG48_9TELE
MVRPPPLPMNFDPRWMMMPYMDPRIMQESFDRQQQHPGHPHRGTPPMDPKLAWGPEVFPGGAENRGLTSPLRQKQALEEDDVVKGPSDTPPHRLREGGLGPIQQPSSSSGTSSQTPPPPVGVQVGNPGGTHHPHQYIGGRGNYGNFPDQGARMPPHPQQRPGERGNQPHNFPHPDDGPSRGSQQVQIWGAPHSHYDRNGRADLPTVEGNSHLSHHHSHHHQQPLNHQKPENSRDRVGEAPAKKSDSSPPLHQPSLSSSCSSSSSSSAREDGKVAQHHPPPLREGEAGVNPGERGSSGNASNTHMKPDKSGPPFLPHSSQTPLQHGGHNQTQQHSHPKSNQRGGREHKTETQWGPRPGSNSMGGGSSHGRRGNNAAGGSNSRGGEDSSSTQSDHKPSNQTGGGNPNKRAGPIKKPLLKEMKREGGGFDGGEKQGKDKEQDGGQPNSMKQDSSSMSQNTSVATKEEQNHTAKARSGGKERSSGGGGSSRGSKDLDSSSSGFSSKRDRERSFERGGGPHPPGVPTKGGRPSRGRGGEFYRGGRGYRGTYTASAGPASAGRGRMGGRSGRDYRSSAGGSHHQEPKGDGSGVRHGQHRSQHNPARARNRSETRSEGSEYEEIPKRRRERGSETGSESGGSDLGHSDKDDHQKPNSKNCSENVSATGNISSVLPRVSQARVFTPRGVPSRRGRGGGGGGGNMYRGTGNIGGPAGGHRVGPGSSSYIGSSKSTASGRKQQGPPQASGPKDLGRGGGAGEKKDKVADGGQNQGANPPQPSLPATTPPAVGSTENGGVITQQVSTNPVPNSAGPNAPPHPANQGHPPGGFERPPRRRRHGRSQHQQDKPPRFRRLKERENAARINGGVGVIGGGRPSSPSLNSVQDSNGAPVSAPITGNTQNANHTSTLSTSNNGGGGQLNNANSHHHHHYNQSNAGPTHPQHHHNHGAKSPDFTNQNSDQANEEWETASESSDFTEFRDREAGGAKSYASHHHHHPGRGGGGGGGGGGVLVDRDMTGKEPSANKRSFSSQRPGMERQNRRVNTGGGGGRGPRGPPGGGSGAPANGGGNRRVSLSGPTERSQCCIFETTPSPPSAVMGGSMQRSLTPRRTL